MCSGGIEPQPCLHQSAGDQPHHLIQKAVSRVGQADFRPQPLHLNGVNAPHGGLLEPPKAAEGAEVVGSHQQCRPLRHSLRIQWFFKLT